MLHPSLNSDAQGAKYGDNRLSSRCQLAITRQTFSLPVTAAIVQLLPNTYFAA